MPKQFVFLFILSFITVHSNSQRFIKDYSCTPIETEAKFKDSANDWNRFLTDNINAAVPQLNCAPPGTYKTEIRFLIGKDGVVSDVKAMSTYGYGMEAEVIRVINNSPKWIPATHNGRTIRAYRHQSFLFAVSNQL